MVKTAPLPSHQPQWCCTGREIDTLLGVVKIRACGPREMCGGEFYGYPHFRFLQAIPDELDGIDPDVWASFWVDVNGLQGRSDGAQCVAVLGLLFCVMVVAISESASLSLGVWCITLIGLICLIPHQYYGMQETMNRVCLFYQDKFAEQGWKVSCHAEEYNPTAPRKDSEAFWVVHFVPLLEEAVPKRMSAIAIV